MTITKQRVTCKCGHVFEAEMVTDAPIDVWIASAKAIRCPKCSSDEVGLGGAYDDAPPLTASVQERAGWWRDRGEVGSSSLTIWGAITGGHIPRGEVCWPLDPDDFRRCHLLLALIPEWHAELGKVTAKFPWFAPFEQRWPEFERLYAKEVATGLCPKLYNAMKVADREAEKLRYGKGK